MAIGRLKQSVYTRTMDCVEQRNGRYYMAGTRISLDSVVYSYLHGESPEMTVKGFPCLSVDQVKAGIAYYLANREAIDKYLAEDAADFDRQAEESRRQHPDLYARLDAAWKARLNRNPKSVQT